METMDDILSDAEPEPPETPVEGATPAEPNPQDIENRKQYWKDKEAEAQGKKRGADGKFVSSGAPVEEAPAAEEKPAPVEAKPAEVVKQAEEQLTDKEKAFLRTAQEERRKRQELEQQIKSLQPPPKPAEPEKPFWDDPEGALKRFEQQAATREVKIRVDTAVALARTRHNDFAEKEALFTELAKTTPGLVQQMLSQVDPAEFAYQTAVNHQRLQEAGSIDALIEKTRSETAAKVEADTRAKVEAEMKAKYEKDAKTRAELPGSLTTAHSKGQNRQVWAGPTSMEDILNG